MKKSPHRGASQTPRTMNVGVMVYRSPGTSFTREDALDGNEP